jgi:hypothetical protein
MISLAFFSVLDHYPLYLHEPVFRYKYNERRFITVKNLIIFLLAVLISVPAAGITSLVHVFTTLTGIHIACIMWIENL